MKSFKNFLNEKIDDEKVNRSIGDIKKQNELIDKYKKKIKIPADGGKKGQSNIERELGLDDFQKQKENLIKQNLRNTERVQRDTYNPTSDSFGPPKEEGPFPETDASKDAKNRYDKNKTKTDNTIKTDNTKKNNVVSSIDKKNRQSIKKITDINKIKSNITNNKLDVVKPNVTINTTKVEPVRISDTNFKNLKDLLKGKISSDQLDKRINPSAETTRLSDIKAKSTLIPKKKELARLGYVDKSQKVNIPVDKTFDKKGNLITKTKKITNQRILSGTTDAAKRYRKLLSKARAGRVLRTLGKGAAGLTSYLDFKATADRERLKGRSKTSQNIAGLSRALGGYVGGALGVAAAAPIPIPGARIAGGIGGYTAGAKAGEELYNIGRKLVTGRGFSGGDKIKQTYTNFKNMLTRKK